MIANEGVQLLSRTSLVLASPILVLATTHSSQAAITVSGVAVAATDVSCSHADPTLLSLTPDVSYSQANVGAGSGSLGGGFTSDSWNITGGHIVVNGERSADYPKQDPCALMSACADLCRGG
jgi:hypothetical protein